VRRLRGRHDRRRLQLGRLDDGRHGRRDGQGGRVGARQELAAAVCVDRFRGAGDAAAQLAALKGLGNAWDRGTFVEKGGWAAMPGPKPAEPASRAARACADQLALLETPPPPAVPARQLPPARSPGRAGPVPARLPGDAR
jgi:hypothetical protein